MCGIAGIIYRDGTHEVGSDMTRMLQSMKHRGPDSTGYALYRPHDDHMVMRYTLADSNTPRDFEFSDRLDRHQDQVIRRLKGMGADIDEVDEKTEYAYRVAFTFPNARLAATSAAETALNMVSFLSGAFWVSDRHPVRSVRAT